MEFCWLDQVRGPRGLFRNLFVLGNLDSVLKICLYFILLFCHLYKSPHRHNFSLKRVVEIVVPMYVMLWLLINIYFVLPSYRIFVPAMGELQERDHLLLVGFFV